MGDGSDRIAADAPTSLDPAISVTPQKNNTSPRNSYNTKTTTLSFRGGDVGDGDGGNIRHHAIRRNARIRVLRHRIVVVVAGDPIVDDDEVVVSSFVALAGADDDGDDDGEDDATHGASVVIRRPGRIVIARRSVVDDAVPRPPPGLLPSSSSIDRAIFECRWR
jgi:hypothetical protein